VSLRKQQVDGKVFDPEATAGRHEEPKDQDEDALPFRLWSEAVSGFWRVRANPKSRRNETLVQEHKPFRYLVWQYCQMVGCVSNV
jgi:hypothetical protein